MTDKKPDDSLGENLKSFDKDSLFLAGASLCALVATFFVSNADIPFQSKSIFFLLVIVSYPAFFGFLYFNNRRTKKPANTSPIADDIDSPLDLQIEAKLFALEEANQFFSATLKSADMFRLVSSRINEIIPFATCAIFFADEQKNNLKVGFAVGENAEALRQLEININKGLAGRVFQSSKPQADENLLLDKNALSVENLKNLQTAIAAPLFHDGEIFGILELFRAQENKFDAGSLQLLDAVGTRIAPILISSRSFEKSLASALTDAVTNLPNERAFFLVLENQIAEAIRFRDERPLTILTVDVKNFDEINKKFGHATGDRILGFVAGVIRKQLRQMDFLARSINDEFLAVLPTASEKITQEIVERVEKAFIVNPFEISAQEKFYLQLNFGAASFLKDGEASDTLLSRALLNKQQSKSSDDKDNILLFPKEYVN